MWERPLPGRRTGRDGPQSGPGNVSGEAEILGPLRDPSRDEGRSHTGIASLASQARFQPVTCAYGLMNDVNMHEST
ncbi:hypothetical protein EDP1_1041 [Pseudomonas putida S610]|nr:hypothetical protein EDP1_1041 [Pseudomonas putida S610]